MYQVQYQFTIILILFILSWSNVSNAQIGIHSQYIIQDIPQLEVPSYNNTTLNNLYSLGFSYWFRLKKVRWEISPTLYYSSQFQTSNDSEDAFSQNSYSIHVQNNFYLMDFKNDCMCPTFSKQGEWIRKGLYVYGAPGFVINEFKINNLGLKKDSQFYGEVGVGIDIGLNNVITISPSLGYRQLFGVDTFEIIRTKSSYNQLVGGVKLMLRWDKENFYRRR